MSGLTDAVVLVTGANGGLGTQFVHQALQQGAATVYATARRPQAWDDPRIVPLALDITDAESVAAVAERAADVTVLVNNAGIAPAEANLLTADEADLRAVFETNLFGQLRMVRAFAPILSRAPGRAAIIDIHSALSWLALAGSYSVSKAAFWALTNAVRLDLAPRGVQVVGVHVGWVDTPMAAGASGPKADPADVVAQAYAALGQGVHEVLVDDLSRNLKAGLAGPVERLYPQLDATASR
jgi:Short-chain dehydrogenases of various substrate specificities